MTLVRLAVAAIAVQLGDALTWASLPAGAERNPVVAAADPWQACGLKAALVVLVLAVAWIVRQRPAIAETVLLAAVIAGALGTGSNLAASTSRTAPEPAPLGEGPSGIEQDVDETSVTPERSAVPSSAGAAAPWPVLVSSSVAARDDDVRPRHVRAPAVAQERGRA